MTTRCIDNPVELTVLPEIPAKYGDCCLIMTSCSGRMAWSCPDFVFVRSCSALGLKGRRRLRPDVALQGRRACGELTSVIGVAHSPAQNQGRDLKLA